MNITDKRIDCGKAFDFGRTSENYAAFRDIYPQRFYDEIIKRDLCIKGHSLSKIPCNRKATGDFQIKKKQKYA